MSDRPDAAPLEYQSPARVRIRRDAEFWRWWRYRVAYRLGLVPLFCAIAFYFGPNAFKFHKLTPPTPADFLEDVQQSGVPVVRAILAYQRDKGVLPDRTQDLVPAYLSSVPPRAYIDNGKLMLWTQWNQQVSYNFGAGPNTWQIMGPGLSGTVPFPPITAGPSTQPARPAR